jgi:hypothetical protein
VYSIELARRQALNAYERAAECIDNHLKEEWLRVARMWEELDRAYSDLQRTQT